MNWLPENMERIGEYSSMRNAILASKREFMKHRHTITTTNRNGIEYRCWTIVLNTRTNTRTNTHCA